MCKFDIYFNAECYAKVITISKTTLCKPHLRDYLLVC